MKRYKVMFIYGYPAPKGGALTSQVVEFESELLAADAMTQSQRDCTSLICVRLYAPGSGYSRI